MRPRVVSLPEAAAKRLLAEAELTFAAFDEPWPGYAVDVDLLAGLVFDLGVQAVPDLKVGHREYAAFLKADSKLIVVEANHHDHRRRFSIAHEIAHYVLHYSVHKGSQGNFHCSPQDMEIDRTPAHTRAAEVYLHLHQEWEANLFAAELLMPEGPLMAMFTTTGGNIGRLAKQFRVSPLAMEIRLNRLPLPFAPSGREGYR